MLHGPHRHAALSRLLLYLCRLGLAAFEVRLAIEAGPSHSETGNESPVADKIHLVLAVFDAVTTDSDRNEEKLCTAAAPGQQFLSGMP